MLRRLVLLSVLLTACTYNYDELRGRSGGTTGSGGQAGSASGGAAGSTPPGSGGQAGISSGGKGGVGGKAGSGGGSGAGGPGGQPSAGGRGGSNVDAGCKLVTDALVDHSTTTCNSTFNFEGNTEGAALVTGSQAFTAAALGAPPDTYCGAGSLAIAATFMGTTGALTKGEVDIPEWKCLTRRIRSSRSFSGVPHLKVRPPAGHAGTAPDSDGQVAENRGLAAVADGPDWPQAVAECQSVSALVAGAIGALDRGEADEARALLEALEIALRQSAR